VDVFIVENVVLNNSMACDGNLLECINLVLDVYKTHNINRDLYHTGQNFIVLSAGVGLFNVYDNTLSNITKKRVGDEGIGIDLISVFPPPLHHVPVFRHVRNKGTPQEVMYYKSPDWINAYFYCKVGVSKRMEKSHFYPRCKMPNLMNVSKCEIIPLPHFSHQTDSNVIYQPVAYEFENHDRDVFKFNKDKERSINSVKSVSRMVSNSKEKNFIIVNNAHISDLQ